LTALTGLSVSFASTGLDLSLVFLDPDGLDGCGEIFARSSPVAALADLRRLTEAAGGRDGMPETPTGKYPRTIIHECEWQCIEEQTVSLSGRSNHHLVAVHTIVGLHNTRDGAGQVVLEEHGAVPVTMRQVWCDK
jgi:hypothetical protein